MATQRSRLCARVAIRAQAAFGQEHPGGAVAQSGALLEVADGQLDGGVAAVVGVQFDGGAGPVGDERVVAPVGPQGRLGADQAGAAHDQPAAGGAG
jgi:hypothetical protein